MDAPIDGQGNRAMCCPCILTTGRSGAEFERLSTARLPFGGTGFIARHPAGELLAWIVFLCRNPEQLLVGDTPVSTTHCKVGL